MSGNEIAKLHHAHNEYVYSLVWSRDDSAIVTCSSDGTAKVRKWGKQLIQDPMRSLTIGSCGQLVAFLPNLDPACANASCQQCVASRNAATCCKSLKSLPPLFALPQVWELRLYSHRTKSIRPLVLRHPCYCYTADFHPNQKLHPLVATGAYDSSVRLWSRNTGQVLAAFQVRAGAQGGEESSEPKCTAYT